MLSKIFGKKQKPRTPEPNLWGSEPTQGSSSLLYNFPASVQAAMQFVFAALHGELPTEIQEHVQLDESPLPKEKVLREIYGVHGITDHGTGRYRDRTLRFVFAPGNLLGDTHLDVYLRQYAGNGEIWKVMSMTYLRKCTDGGRTYEKYEVIVTPYVEDVGTEKEHLATSGFRLEYWD